jgi:SAM-dependent methyltransferase
VVRTKARVCVGSPDAGDDSNEWDRVATSRWGAYVTDIERRAVLRAHEVVRGPGVGLDLGCGAGRWSRLLVDRGWQMVCTDVNAQALRICQRRIPSARCIQRLPEEDTLPCASGSIDLLLCIEVPPVMKSDWFLRESRRVLRAGGTVVAVCWNMLSGRGLFCHARARAGLDTDFYNTAYLTWKRKVSENGFRVVHDEGFCWFPHRRNSNSGLVPYSISLERLLGLRKVVALSPWVVVVLQKIAGD